MKYFEFGREHPELMVILHGGGVCYRGALPVAEEMAKTYHVRLAWHRQLYGKEAGQAYQRVEGEGIRLYL